MNMKKNNNNFLDKMPCRSQSICWKREEGGNITLEIENTGFFNRLSQKLFKRPRVSYVHLDELGSFVWNAIDGEKTIADIATLMVEEFGEKANPLYARLIKYFQILESYDFIIYK